MLKNLNWQYGATLVLTGWLALAVTGCGTRKQADADPAGNPPDPLAVTEGEPLVIDAPGGNAAAPAKPLSEADQAWLDFQQATKTPDPPEAWQEKKPSDEEVATFKRGAANQLVQAADKAKDFYTRFPQHEQAAEAHRQEIGLLNFAVQLGNTNVSARVEQLEAARLKDPALSEDDRLELRVQQLQRVMASSNETNKTASLKELEQGVRALQKEFPQRPEIWGLMLFAAERWLEANEGARASALAAEVAAADVDEELKTGAAELQRRAGRLGKPLALKYTAIDGREVDLQKMPNKVVLVDFWATWCRPCMAELPNVKAAYEKLHPKGFEIVGISFDKEKAALERVVKQEQMAWPQYFETGTGEHQFGETFDISSIPTMWLVDKKGVLRDLNGRENLAAKVEKLLAE